MLYSILIFCAVLSLSLTAPTIEDAQAKTLSYENNNDGLGNYKFSFKTSNGLTQRETGRLVNVGLPGEHLEVQGSYSYFDPEGQIVTVNYTADENGYRTEGGDQLTDMQPDFIPELLEPVVVSALPPSVVATLLGG